MSGKESTDSNESSTEIKTIAIIGGTGALGTGLARRWAEAGYRVIIGSRTEEKAAAALAQLHEYMQQRGVTQLSVEAMENQAAAEAADLVAMTVPYAHHNSTLESIKAAVQSKILVDVTVPLRPPKVARVQLPAAGCAAIEAQTLLGEQVQVVSAFQNVAAHHLQAGQGDACDVLVAGDSKAARAVVITLVEACGMRGFSAGPLANSAAAEALTSVLIHINKNHKCHAGIQITGTGEPSASTEPSAPGS